MKSDEPVPTGPCELSDLAKSLREKYLRRRFCLVMGEDDDPDEPADENYTLRLQVGGQDFCLSNHYQGPDETAWSADQAAKALEQIILDQP